MINELHRNPIDIEQQIIAGQNSAIRAGDANDPEDVKRMLELINSEGFQSRFTVKDRPYTIEDAKDRLEPNPLENLDLILQGTKKIYSRFIISGRTKHHDDEVGELQGNVSFSVDRNGEDINPKLDTIRKELGLITMEESQYPRLEMTWSKHPEAKEKQMASGVRQVLWEIFKKTTSVTEIVKKVKPHQPIAIIENKYNHLDDLEPSSSKILSHQNGKYIDPSITFNTSIVVIAYIEPDNEDSIKVAHAAGFVKIHDDAHPKPHDIYQLDWRVLQNRIKTKSLHI